MSYTVIGYPVKHSLSPAMQNAALRYCGIADEYTATEVLPGNVAAFAENARHALNGFNLTVPHKFEIVPCLDECEETARASGSVNTVTVRNGKLYGCSTDGYGLETALHEAFHQPLAGASVIFCGCGGVAHATAFHLARCGAEIALFNRSMERARELQSRLESHFHNRRFPAYALDDEQGWKTVLPHADFLIQSTSVGLKEEDPVPFPAEFLQYADPELCVFDTIYRKTALLRLAEKSNLRYANGLGMLLHQGAKSFTVWTGLPAPVEVMRKALSDAGGVFLC